MKLLLLPSAEWKENIQKLNGHIFISQNPHDIVVTRMKSTDTLDRGGACDTGGLTDTDWITT